MLAFCKRNWVSNGSCSGPCDSTATGWNSLCFIPSAVYVLRVKTRLLSSWLLDCHVCCICHACWVMWVYMAWTFNYINLNINLKRLCSNNRYKTVSTIKFTVCCMQGCFRCICLLLLVHSSSVLSKQLHDRYADAAVKLKTIALTQTTHNERPLLIWLKLLSFTFNCITVRQR